MENQMNYRKIFVKIWADPTFQNLSKNAKIVFFYLMTSPHSNGIGLYVLQDGYALVDLEKTLTGEEYKEARGELAEVKMIQFDEEYSVVFIKNFLRYNSITSPKHAVGVAKKILDLPPTKFIDVFRYWITQPEIKNFAQNECLISVIDKILKSKRRNHALEPQIEEGTEEPENPPEGERTEEEEVRDQKLLQDAHQLIQAWNAICADAGLPEVREAIPSRIQKAKIRLRENPDIHSYWVQVFQKIIQTPFLMGENDRGWRATYDWVVANQENALGVLEGKYDNIRQSKARPKLQVVAKDLWGTCPKCKKETLLEDLKKFECCPACFKPMNPDQIKDLLSKIGKEIK